MLGGPHRPLCASRYKQPLARFMAEIARLEGVQQVSFHDDLHPCARQDMRQIRLRLG